MKMTIEIDLSNDTLSNDEWGSELSLILESVVRLRTMGNKESGLYDTNGNKVGKYSIK